MTGDTVLSREGEGDEVVEHDDVEVLDEILNNEVDGMHGGLWLFVDCG